MLLAKNKAVTKDILQYYLMQCSHYKSHIVTEENKHISFQFIQQPMIPSKKLNMLS